MNLDQKKQAKMQWLQHPDQSNVHNLNNIRREDSRHFRNKKKQYLKSKFTILKESLKKSENGIGVSVTLMVVTGLELNVVQDEKDDLFTIFHSVSAR
jgi:hypothetical protein